MSFANVPNNRVISIREAASVKATTVFISRIGRVGGAVAMQLAAAGVGRLILAHAGDLRLDDMNRQLLMATENGPSLLSESLFHKT
jgi:tRNA A37 threonylcarbamoyladenosine dehydratase